MTTQPATNPRIHQRLEQWQHEATDPSHPNHYHAELDSATQRYSEITRLIAKLRNKPEDFDQHDVAELFGQLNSGQRTKNRIATQNDLDTLRHALLTLIDNPGSPAQNIKRAADNIRFAGKFMIGELYGWLHPETAPLHNQCAIEALHHLGYQFNHDDYESFLQAHNAFKSIYQAEVGQLRPDLPQNLEIDRFYNVIHKVDFRSPSDLLAEPFSSWVDSREQMDWALDQLKEVLDALGATGPDDKRIALTIPRNRDILRLNFGNLWMWDLCGKNCDYIKFGGQNAISQRLDPKIFTPQGRHEIWGDMVCMPLSDVMQHDETLRSARKPPYRYYADRFAQWQGSPFRPHHRQEICDAVYDPQKRGYLYEHGLTPRADPEPHPNAMFKPATFALLSDLHQQPTKEFYQSHKDEFQSLLEEPFKKLMRRVAEQLPPAVHAVMETQKRVVARILKNDYGQGLAWDHYWGAFYPKGSRRAQNAQLAAWIDRNLLECGFYIGDYGSAERDRFQHNCERLADTLAPLFENALNNDLLLFGTSDTFVIDPTGLITQMPDDEGSWRRFFENPAAYDYDVSVVLSRQQLLQKSEDELVNWIAEVHRALFPLVLVALHDDPMPAVADYFGITPDDDADDLPVTVDRQPPYSLPDMATETGFDLPLLERWVRAIDRKKQVIFFGPPGTGKSYAAQHLAKHLIAESDGFVDLVQFHPAYAYEDFIQGIRPDVVNGQLSYQMVPGRFLDFCHKAAQRNDTCVLIVDEINRANLARVFGELMYLLEYRNEEIPLAGGGTLRIPDNVRILGTMNTADRSIALVDHALRRRFAFLSLAPDPELLRHYHHRRQTGFQVDRLIALLSEVNREIADPHYELGISFFMRDDIAHEIADVWQMEIEPYLAEYFFDRPDKALAFTWIKVHGSVLP